LLAFVPVTLDLYRTVRRHLHWTLQNLVAFADRAGRCFPSVRTLAACTGQPRSTVSRHLAQLAQEGVVTRQRRAGGCYAYTIAKAFLPAARGVSHHRERGVPPPRTEEQRSKKTERFAGILDDHGQWRARLSAWRSSGGRFWPTFAGPRPGEPGCFVPAALLQAES
jgi:DNA-binding transcriptional MocR family regulator